MFLVSDFIAPDYKKPLRIVGRRHDLIAVSVADLREAALPDVGLIELEDAETGSRVLVDTSSKRVRNQYAELAARRRIELRELFRSLSVDQVEVETGEDYVRDLMLLFRRRERRR